MDTRWTIIAATSINSVLTCGYTPVIPLAYYQFGMDLFTYVNQSARLGPDLRHRRGLPAGAPPQWSDQPQAVPRPAVRADQPARAVDVQAEPVRPDPGVPGVEQTPGE